MKKSSPPHSLTIEAACNDLAKAMIAVAMHPECPTLVREQIDVFYSAVEPEIDQTISDQVRLTHLLPEAVRGACTNASRARQRRKQRS
jgi:hypothetical protein